jgi:DNA-nicking Smr family endonuclease
MPKVYSRRRRQPTADELALWAAAVRDAAPLDGRAVEAATEPTPEPAPQPSPKKALAAKHAVPIAPSRRDLPIGRLERQDLARLRRGTVTLDGRIDLHGLTEEQAHHAVDRFIELSWSTGRRLVLVITGKGGVLRALLPRWLAASRHRGRVLGVSEASPRHGGSGAYYLRLRRRH